MKIKKVIWCVGLALILLPAMLYVGLAVYVLQTAEIEELMVSTSPGAVHIPPKVVREWIFAFRGAAEDVERFHASIGIAWIFASPRQDWDKMASFWLGKGVDINHRDPRTLLTALQGTALAGESEQVEFLLKLGADPMVRDPKRGFTALELAERGLAHGFYANTALHDNMLRSILD